MCDEVICGGGVPLLPCRWRWGHRCREATFDWGMVLGWGHECGAGEWCVALC